MGISIWQLLIILAIVLVLFGAKRLRNVGGDLGGAIKGFRQAMKEDDQANPMRNEARTSPTRSDPRSGAACSTPGRARRGPSPPAPSRPP